MATRSLPTWAHRQKTSSNLPVPNESAAYARRFRLGHVSRNRRESSTRPVIIAVRSSVTSERQ
jgi:hypothetical protein